MAKPLLVLAQFASEPFKKLPKVIDELPLQVPDAPPDLTLVLWKPVATSTDVNSWVKLSTTSLSITFNAQTCPHAALKSSTTRLIVKAWARSMVITLAPGLTLTILQAQSIRIQLDCLNKSFTGCLNT
jgi:hypothetical protein